MDKELEKRIEEIRSVNRFRVIFGIKVKSRKAMGRLFRWLDEHRLTIADAQLCRHHIRAEEPEILCAPTKAWIGGIAALAVPLIALVYVGLLIAASPYVFVTVNATGRHYLLSQQEATTFLATKRVAVSPASCGTGLTVAAGSDEATLCGIVGDKNYASFVTENVRDQRVVGAVMGGLFLTVLLSVVGLLKSGWESKLLQERIVATGGVVRTPLPEPGGNDAQHDPSVQQPRKRGRQKSGNGDGRESDGPAQTT